MKDPRGEGLPVVGLSFAGNGVRVPPAVAAIDPGAMERAAAPVE
jgi:hypothetical protein